jgi:hypothetical protein
MYCNLCSFTALLLTPPVHIYMGIGGSLNVSDVTILHPPYVPRNRLICCGRSTAKSFDGCSTPTLCPLSSTPHHQRNFLHATAITQNRAAEDVCVFSSVPVQLYSVSPLRRCLVEQPVFPKRKRFGPVKLTEPTTSTNKQATHSTRIGQHPTDSIPRHHITTT